MANKHIFQLKLCKRLVMSSSYFFSTDSFTTDLLEDLEAIFYDCEGKFPIDQLEIFINNNNFDVKEFSENLVQYAVFKGTEIATQDDFFSFITAKIGKVSPKVILWRCYDALIRGNLDVFEKLWSIYTSIELKNYSKNFIIEAIVIPEDPVFLNVTAIVHDHQQRVIKQFILPADQTKELADADFDALLQEYTGDYSLVLSYFRLLQSSFQRNVAFQDLDNLLTLLRDDNISSLGPYWECRFLATMCSWKVSLGLIFDVVDNLNQFKNLNVEASNFLFESQIFLLEAQIAFKNNNVQDSKELLQSALYLAQEYKFFYQLMEVIFAKFEIDIQSLSETVELLFSLTNEKHHPLVRAKMYANLGAYYIQQKNWSEAEKNLLTASKLVQGSYDKKTYYQVISDFSYVLVITNQLHEALEASRVLLDDNVSILYRIRGFYLYALTLLLLGQKNDCIEILVEGIRIVISFKEHISLPWFYELLEIIYLSLNDIETALRYSNLTYKAYFESSDAEFGYRSKLISSYLLALQNDFGHAVTQLSGLLSEITTPEQQLEVYSAIQTILIASQESINVSQLLPTQAFLDTFEDTLLVKQFIIFKSNLINKDTKTNKFLFNGSSSTTKNQFNNLIFLENYLLLITKYSKLIFENVTLQQVFSDLKNFISSLPFTFVILNNSVTLIDMLDKKDSVSNLKTDILSDHEKNTLIFSSFLLSILRLVNEKLPFNFLTSRKFEPSK